jgi:hypothetical protein
MTKVVIQGREYWLREEFWQEARDAGFEAILVEIKNGIITTRTISRDEFAARFPGRVANWVKSEPKSISVFREALGDPGQKLLNQLYRDSILAGLETVASEFTARTRAQGKVRLPAEAHFVVVIHTHAKDGSPQLHAHIAVGDRVKVQGQAKTYATHKCELYQLRKLFAATATHHFGNRLQTEFGVRVQKTDQGLVLPDVPKSLCERSSVRTKQIDDYIKRHNLKNTPLTRKYAAIVTRRENRDPLIGRNAFREEVARTGFKAEQIINRVSRDQHLDVNDRSVVIEIQRIGRVGKNLSKSQGPITRNELLTRAMETAELHRPISHIKRATEAVHIHRRKNGLDKTVSESRRYTKQWQKVIRKIGYILRTKKEEQSRTESNHRRTNHERAKFDDAHTSQQSQKRPDQEPRPNPVSEQSSDIRRVVEKALRSYQVIGAVGHVGIKAAEIAVELYQTWAKPVWRVHGNGHKTTPGSVAKMVRDLKPLSMVESHKTAITAMLKLNGTLEQKLRYGEYVYRQSRKAKFRIPKKSLIVIRDVGQANPKDVNFLLRKAERAKAKTIFVENEHSKFALMQVAKSMKPGEHLHFHEQDMKR